VPKIVEVVGESRHKAIISKTLTKLHDDNIRKALRKHGKEVKDELIKVVTTGPRTGRFYTYRGRKYQASARGEPPAKRSGRLSESFMYKSRPLELLIANTARSKHGAPYPLFLQDGTINMERRPYFDETIERLESRLESMLEDFEG